MLTFWVVQPRQMPEGYVQGFGFRVSGLPIGSLVVPFLGLPYRILNMNHKKELLRSLWVESKEFRVFRIL